MIGIYKIISPNGGVYVGKSKNIEKRFKQHSFKTTNKLLKLSFDKYGIENHIFEVIEECEIDKLIEREQFYIKLFDSNSVVFNESTLNHIQYKRNVPIEFVEELDRYLGELKLERQKKYSS